MGYVNDGAHVRAYCGAVGTGKTYRLVQDVAALVAGGADPADVLVLAAGPSAADALAGRIAQACPQAAGVRVTTPTAWALQVLGTPAAQAFTGRDAHVLQGYEQDFFFEDMRVNGTKQHRLREMLKFFYRGWSEMRDGEDGWLITVEEKDVHALAKRSLAMLSAYHPCEVVAACVRYLAQAPDALAEAQVAHVFADDFRAMGRASQRLCALLAREGLTVAWDDMEPLEGEEPYGYAAGLAELEQDCGVERVGLEGFHGGASAHEALVNLYKQDSLAGEAPAARDASEGGIDVRMVGMLDDEPASVVAAVREALEAGVAPQDVFVAAGRPAWVGRMQSALEKAGVPVSRVGGCMRLPGDVRDPDGCADAEMLGALRLVADPRSSLAWRCWCGFGDYLCCSAAFSDLSRALAEMPGARLCDLLDALVGEGDLKMEGDLLDRQRLEARVRAGRALIDEARGLAGGELLACVRSHVCTQGQETPAFDALVEGALGEAGEAGRPAMTAAELVAFAQARLTPQPPAPGCVRVGGLDDLLGQTPQTLVLCGLVNGLYPERGYFDLLQKSIDDQAKLHVKLVGQLVQVCGKAQGALVLSGFTHADILDSEPMKLMSERIRLRAGHRVCEFAPSAVVDYVTGAKTSYVR